MPGVLRPATAMPKAGRSATAAPEELVDLVVIGAGIAGLTVARDCVAAGLSVVVLEASAAPGGMVSRGQCGPVSVDTGAESFALRGGHVLGLIEDLGLSSRVVAPAEVGAWFLLPGRRGRDLAVRIPRRTVLGIPAWPLARDVRRAIGWAGAVRALAERLMPRSAASRGSSLAEVVRARMGRRVLERLVAPICVGVYSTTPDGVTLEAVAPALAAELRRGRSLGRAVARSAPQGRAGGAVAGLDGGMYTLVEALAAAVTSGQGAIVTTRRAVAIDPPKGAGGFFVVRVVEAKGEEPGAARAVRARGVVVATPRTVAVALLQGLLPASAPGLASATSVGIEVVTLGLAAPTLDERPRGTGIIAGPGLTGLGAKALTHSTAKWPWLAHATGRGNHIIRLSYERLPSDPSLSDEELADVALRDASRLLGVPLGREQQRALLRTPWPEASTPRTTEAISESERWREAASAQPGLEIVGAWVAGTGLASVVADARACAARIIRGTIRG